MTAALTVLLAAAAPLPVFRGYEAPRYQKHDALIVKYVDEFNAKKKTLAGATARQSEGIAPLDPALVKAHMIQETGGNDARSRAAWEIDPLQVNVPGDWNSYKAYLGLRKPRHSNEGSREKNIKAGISYLSRKGFGTAGQPAANRPEATFDGWKTALERYNGRTTETSDGKPYREVYADKIQTRSTDPDTHVPVQIKVK